MTDCQLSLPSLSLSGVSKSQRPRRGHQIGWAQVPGPTLPLPSLRPPPARACASGNTWRPKICLLSMWCRIWSPISTETHVMGHPSETGRRFRSWAITYMTKPHPLSRLICPIDSHSFLKCLFCKPFLLPRQARALPLCSHSTWYFSYRIKICLQVCLPVQTVSSFGSHSRAPSSVTSCLYPLSPL